MSAWEKKTKRSICLPSCVHFRALRILLVLSVNYRQTCPCSGRAFKTSFASVRASPKSIIAGHPQRHRTHHIIIKTHKDNFLIFFLFIDSFNTQTSIYRTPNDPHPVRETNLPGHETNPPFFGMKTLSHRITRHLSLKKKNSFLSSK